MPDLIELAEAGLLTFTWRAVGDKHMCKEPIGGCEARHGDGGFTLQEWQNLGLPGTGWSACQGQCRCVLLPDNLLSVESEILEPFEIGPALEEIVDFQDPLEKARIAMNIRLMEDFRAGTRVAYQGPIQQMRGASGVVRPGVSPNSMTIDFDFPPSDFPEFASLVVSDFTQVVPLG
jgi:hypothetical protein